MGLKRKIAIGLMGLVGLVTGCGSAKPVDKLETLRQARKARTAQSVRDFSQGIQTMNQTAVGDYTNTALDNESKDMKTIDTVRANRDKTVKLGKDLYKHMQGTVGGKRSRRNSPNGQDSSFGVYATATARLDGQSEPAFGGEFVYKSNETYFSAGVGPQSSTRESNASSDLTRKWDSLILGAGKYKQFGKLSTKAGVKIIQERISTEGMNGITYIDDEDLKYTPLMEVGIEFDMGMLRGGLEAAYPLTKDDTNKQNPTITAKIGVDF